MSHPTRRIATNYADIDEEIIPLVVWLNRLNGVTTYWCCQGGVEQEAYIVFTCSGEAMLAILLEKFRGFATVEVDWYGGMIRYCPRFRNQKVLTQFIELYCRGENAATKND